MKAFFTACLAAIVLAAIGLVVLNHVQEPVDEAFAGRIGQHGFSGRACADIDIPALR
jgi:hypothetical protein